MFFDQFGGDMWKTFAASVFSLGVCTSASGGLLVDFTPGPDSDVIPELIWDGIELHDELGFSGTGFGVPGPGSGGIPGAGDGEDPIAIQASPGLILTVPFNVPGIPGSDEAGGPTTVYDAAMELIAGGLKGIGPAITTPVAPGVVQLTQLLTPGQFKIWSTDPKTPLEDDVTLLLEGEIFDAIITGLEGTTTGAILSASVRYDSGAILAASGVASGEIGELSWTLLDIHAPLSVHPTTDQLAPFVANSNGQFSVVPEPGTAVLALAGTLVMLSARRRRTA